MDPIIDNEFLLLDRVAKIKSMNEQWDLEHNAYISYSGGKDSTVLSHLIDEARPSEATRHHGCLLACRTKTVRAIMGKSVPGIQANTIPIRKHFV